MRLAPELGLTLALLVSGVSVVPHALAAQRPADGVGRLEGHVVLSRELSQRRPRFRLYAERGGQPLPPNQASDTVEYGNVVVYFDSMPGVAIPVPTSPFAMRQRGETFEPHVLAVPVGATVQFPNDDPFFHNVFSLSRARRFDLGRYPRGASKSVVFDRPGVVQVFCHIHSDMSAFVLVRENPFFAVPDSRGRFIIDGVPPGEYRVVAWHERVRPYAARVKIEAGSASVVEFTIPLPDGQRQ